ncbi:hypothetical protein BDK51DRAFT_44514 [Blyttiomyces helicus]|uniref:Bulb-type lectin domain-containing protein n=1 Tax=Blyttiomyces helicus TaxID=388810 RepID=A0A4V1IS39_9FUNG|nr:hypothetical protein BDK51DRAFT_44514 [Blyttiomyces helicus]|eukprot:RKO92217.1 hypothetical protein BDK51DRAFT_44514 [Blyttiomyces helicus]
MTGAVASQIVEYIPDYDELNPSRIAKRAPLPSVPMGSEQAINDLTHHMMTNFPTDLTVKLPNNTKLMGQSTFHSQGHSLVYHILEEEISPLQIIEDVGILEAKIMGCLIGGVNPCATGTNNLYAVATFGLNFTQWDRYLMKNMTGPFTQNNYWVRDEYDLSRLRIHLDSSSSYANGHGYVKHLNNETSPLGRRQSSSGSLPTNANPDTIVCTGNSASNAPLPGLSQGQSLISRNGLFWAIMQGDGNFVIYTKSGSIWSTRTNGKGVSPYSMNLAYDGTLNVLSGNGVKLWTSNVSLSPLGCTASGCSYGISNLVMQDDGNLVIYVSIFGGPLGAIWSTNTWSIMSTLTSYGITIFSNANLVSGMLNTLWLDIPGKNTAPGTAMWVDIGNGGWNQMWTLNAQQQLVSTTPSGSLCLDAGNSPTAQSPVITAICSITELGQRWTYVNGILFTLGGLCMDAKGAVASPHTPIMVDTCNGGSNQQWGVQVSSLVVTSQGGAVNLPSASTIMSPSGSYHLSLQPDGNLVVYSSAGPPVWASQTDHGTEITEQWNTGDTRTVWNTTYIPVIDPSETSLPNTTFPAEQCMICRAEEGNPALGIPINCFPSPTNNPDNQNCMLSSAGLSPISVPSGLGLFMVALNVPSSYIEPVVMISTPGIGSSVLTLRDMIIVVPPSTYACTSSNTSMVPVPAYLVVGLFILVKGILP